MNGWVIVYLPGGDVYDMLDTSSSTTSLRKRLIRKGIKTFLVAIQLWWWVKT
jgi:hypothetical protein